MTKWLTIPLFVSICLFSILVRPVKAQAPLLAPDQQLEATINRLIQCESGGKNVVVLDTNGKYSYGILQYQLATWNWFSSLSGINGEPMNQEDAVKMARWAIKNGFGPQWSCWNAQVIHQKLLIPAE